MERAEERGRKARKSRIALFIGLVFWAFIQPVSAQQKTLALMDQYSILAGHIDKAKNAFQRDDLPACQKEALFCLDRLPEHHEAHFLLSQILYKRGEFGPALEHIQAAEDGSLRLSKVVAELYQQKMAKRMDNVADLGDDVQGAEAAEDAARDRGTCRIDKYSKSAQDAKDKLANETKSGEGDESAKTLDVPADYHFIHGNCLFRLKRLPEAEAEYRLAVGIDPGHSGACNNLINLLFMEGRPADARASLSEAEAHKAVINPGLKKAVLDAAGK
jgi:tetratricopeptide (TPR) repeat protein